VKLPSGRPPGKTADDPLQTSTSLGHYSGQGEAWSDDHGHATADQITNQLRHAVVLALQPVVFDRDVLAFDETRLAKAFPEPGFIGRRPAIN
jgi:hypothetical protein